MPVIICHDRRIDTGGGNVLSSLERAGIRIPASCRTGHCQSCVAQLRAGSVDPGAQRGLNPRQRHLNYFLTCQCRPSADIEIDLLDDACRRRATLVEKRALDLRVLRVRLRVAMDWRAGQYLTLWRNGHQGRIYSIASRPEEGFVELHVRRRGGVISGWLEHALQVGGECEVSLPRGDCYYSPAMPGQPLLLVGIGTGLAPVYGVLRQALAEGHHGPIVLYAVAATPAQVYLARELEALARARDDLQVVPVVRRAPPGSDALTGDLVDLLGARHPRLRGHLVYLCGRPSTVHELRSLCFMRGACYSDIFCDPFDAG